MLPLFYFYATSLLCWRTKLFIERYKEIYTYVIALENRKPFYNLVNIDNITTLCTNLAYMSYPAFRCRSQELETVGNQSTKFSDYLVVFKKLTIAEIRHYQRFPPPLSTIRILCYWWKLYQEYYIKCNILK